ncbi:MAG: HPr family phosphocarrier protein [Alphaproteobacteria bacterium]
MSAHEQNITIINSRGMHARAAAKFVRLAETFTANVEVSRNGTAVGGTSIMGLMLLAAAKGSEINIKVTGEQAAEAFRALVELVQRGFDEE